MGLLLASPAGPWLVILLIALIGLGLWVLAGPLSGARKAVMRVAAAIALVLASLMVFGASAMAVGQAKLAAARPPSGKLVDVGGYRVFVTCEGPKSAYTVIWLSGGYGNGWYMKPLHDRMKLKRRSCLIDRPGTGWADDGPMPRSVDQILREIHDGLAGAGETGPLILAGHSMGGLYAVNYADAYPAQVKAIVLLDPTPVRWSVEQIQLMGCGAPTPATFNVWATAYGLGLVPALNPLFGHAVDDQRAALGDMWPRMVAMESRPRSLIAANAAGQYACTHGLDLVQTPGALGDLPVLKIVQAVRPDAMKEAPAQLNARERRNWLRMRQDWEREYVSDTTHGVLIHAPAAYDHQFPIVHADWTFAQIEPFLESLETPSLKAGSAAT